MFYCLVAFFVNKYMLMTMMMNNDFYVSAAIKAKTPRWKSSP